MPLEGVALGLLSLRHLLQSLSNFGALLLPVEVVQLGLHCLFDSLFALELDDEVELMEVLAGPVLDTAWWRADPPLGIRQEDSDLKKIEVVLQGDLGDDL